MLSLDGRTSCKETKSLQSKPRHGDPLRFEAHCDPFGTAECPLYSDRYRQLDDRVLRSRCLAGAFGLKLTLYEVLPMRCCEWQKMSAIR